MSQGEPPPHPTPKTPLASPHIQNHLVTPVQPQSTAIHHTNTGGILQSHTKPLWISPPGTQLSPKPPLPSPRATSSALSTPQHRLATFHGEFSGGSNQPGGLHLPRWTHWRAVPRAPREATSPPSLVTDNQSTREPNPLAPLRNLALLSLSGNTGVTPSQSIKVGGKPSTAVQQKGLRPRQR
jgi:hypothetical protein